MTRLQSALVLCCALACTARAQIVIAQSTPADKPSDTTKEEASAHFKRGAELFQDGLYRAALVELRRAYEIAPNYRVLYNIAQTHVALGEFVEAIRAYEGYLSEGGPNVSGSRRAEIEAELGQLRHNTATLSVHVNRAGALVTLDDKNVGAAPLAQDLSVSVGRHEISARAEDGSSASAQVDVAGGDRKEVVLELVAARVTALPIAANVAVPAKPKLTQRQKWAVGVLSSAGALAVTGGGLALSAKFAHDDYQRKLDARPGSPEAIDNARDRLWRTSLTADVMFGAALLSGAGGLVLLFLKDRHREEKRDAKRIDVHVGFGPRTFVAEGRF